MGSRPRIKVRGRLHGNHPCRLRQAHQGMKNGRRVLGCSIVRGSDRGWVPAGARESPTARGQAPGEWGCAVPFSYQRRLWGRPRIEYGAGSPSSPVKGPSRERRGRSPIKTEQLGSGLRLTRLIVDGYGQRDVHVVLPVDHHLLQYHPAVAPCAAHRSAHRCHDRRS